MPQTGHPIYIDEIVLEQQFLRMQKSPVLQRAYFQINEDQI
jgi:hypothetical protein